MKAAFIFLGLLAIITTSVVLLNNTEKKETRVFSRFERHEQVKQDLDSMEFAIRMEVLSR